MRRHTLIGERIILAAPSLAQTARSSARATSGVDGTGYPDGLRATRSRSASRIIAVCDAFDAMISDRSYRAGDAGRRGARRAATATRARSSTRRSSRRSRR